MNGDPKMPVKYGSPAWINDSAFTYIDKLKYCFDEEKYWILDEKMHFTQ